MTLSTTFDIGLRQRVREVVRQHARLPVDVSTLSDTADLYQAGLTSHASVNLMLALEDAFEVEFPDALLLRRTFESIAAMADALARINSPGRQ
jgi:acyl carrier protein